MNKLLSLLFVAASFCAFASNAASSATAEEPNAASSAPSDFVMPEGYRRLWTDELQRRIDERIEKYRKADATLELIDVAPGSEVKVEQIRARFLFGSQIFNFDQLGTDERNAKYKALFGDDGLFNSATIGFYWNSFAPEPGPARFCSTAEDAPEYWNAQEKPWEKPNWRRPAPDRIIDFCEARGVQIHGHPMIYMAYRPKWVSVAPEKFAETEAQMTKHIDEIAEFTKDRIGSWDVVNESVDLGPDKPRLGYKLPDDYTMKSLQEAARILPKETLLNVNDSWRDVYPPFIKDLLVRGAKIDAIGLQMHLFTLKEADAVARGEEVKPNNTSWKPVDVEAYLDELTQLGRPLHLSEITIPAPGKDERSEAIQAIMTRDMYRLWFSWPSIYRITWWNVVDDCGLSGEPTTSGLFTRDMRPKPAYFALDKLINDEWKTRFSFVAESERVEKAFRGFKGDYRATWKDRSGVERSKEFSVD